MLNVNSRDLLNNEQKFAIERMYYQRNVNMNDTHFHSHYEILYLQTGQRNIYINNVLSYTLNSNNIALLRPNILHRTTSCGDGTQTRLLINISAEMMNDLVSTFSKDILACFDMPVLDLTHYEISMLNYLSTELIDNDKNSVLYEDRVRINLSKILLVLSEAYFKSPHENELLYSNQSIKERVDYVIKYFHKNFHTNISIAELADQLLCTETYLSRIFKRITGTTPYKYLMNIRIINAKKLLRSQRMSISDIGFSCGFNSLMAFSRAFKQIQGCSPKEYQRTLLENTATDD